jgi:Na+/H+ antiporter NhaD/arsenite permease-like protein
LVTYGLLIFRKIGRRTIPVWGSMAIGALLMLVTFSISPAEAFDSIDFRVISFLFGILVINAGFEKSGLLEYIVLSMLRRSQNLSRLLLIMIFGAGMLSAFLVNDGIALMLTPIALSFTTRLGLIPKSFLIPVAFAITTGSTFTPIGNPQNVLVALNSGMSDPFGQFALFLFVPAAISLLAVYALSRILFKRDYNLARNFDSVKESLQDSSKVITDSSLAKLSASVLIAMVISFIIVEILPYLQAIGFTFGNLALSAGIAILVLSPRRLYLLTAINWGILIFFAGMFVVMRAVWDSNIGSILLSYLPRPNAASNFQSTGAIMVNSVLLSQVLSNVPFVQLYTYEMHALSFTGASTIPWLALAAGSTLAGNLTLLGAVSNVIIVDSSERRGSKAFSFLDFLKYGIVATVVTCAIFYVFLVLF